MLVALKQLLQPTKYRLARTLSSKLWLVFCRSNCQFNSIYLFIENFKLKKVESRDRAPGVVANIKVGKLSLVDLAGSERAANTKNVGQRLVEGFVIYDTCIYASNCQCKRCKY